MRKNFNSLSDFCKSDVGLLQGEVISPFLFFLFVNDLEAYLEQKSKCKSYTRSVINVFVDVC